MKAAEVLNVSQSAVSHIIKKIEDEQGFHLFIRNRNNVELTVNGQLLMPYVKNLLECNRALDQHLQDFESAAKGEVRIAAFNSATRLWLPRIINSFHDKEVRNNEEISEKSSMLYYGGGCHIIADAACCS